MPIKANIPFLIVFRNYNCNIKTRRNFFRIIRITTGEKNNVKSNKESNRRKIGEKYLSK
jgi:hypothetical protein